MLYPVFFARASRLAVLAACMTGISCTAVSAQIVLPPSRPPDLSPAKPEAPKADSGPAGPSTNAAPAAAAAPPAEPAPVGGACLARLGAVAGNKVSVAGKEASSPKDPACKVDEPVVVEALAAGASQAVRFEPPVTVSCAMAARLADWLSVAAQPLAKGYFGQDLRSLSVGGGHECRRRNRAASGPLSEHSNGKALDIFALSTGDPKTGHKVVVEKPDGSEQAGFLQAVRRSACGSFSTSIGPGADAMHANHLHIDIQDRRSPASRFCQ